MTEQEFENTGFTGGMYAVYNGQNCKVIQVDFEEGLIGIDENISGGEPGDVSWKRYENIERVITPQPAPQT